MFCASSFCINMQINYINYDPCVVFASFLLPFLVIGGGIMYDITRAYFVDF